MDKSDNDGKIKALGDLFEGIEPSPLPPIAPDGGFAPSIGIGPPAAIPEATPANFVCLRGPCRHYWEVVSHFESGNPAETWKKLKRNAPRLIHRSCLAHPGTETEMQDDIIYDCNRWDPFAPGDQEVADRDRRRDHWLRANPNTIPPNPYPSQLEEPSDDDHDPAAAG